MSARYEAKLREQAKPYLEPGEEITASLMASPRGSTQMKSSVPSLYIGARKVQRANAAGDSAGFALANPMALALTQRRLLAFRISSPLGFGMRRDVKELVASAELADVDSLEVHPLMLGATLTLTVNGVPIELEAGPRQNTKRFLAALRT